MAIKFKTKKKKSLKVLSAKPEKASAAKAEVDREGWIQIAMLRTIASPRIGKFNVLEELDRKQLKQGKSYYLPPHAAQHLKDVGAAVIVGEDSDDEDEDDE